MALYLVQHGLSLPKDKDPEQGLSQKGKQDTERMADVAAGYGIKVSRIIHSVKKRARQTAEIFASKLNPPKGLEEKTGYKPMDDIVAIALSVKTGDDHMIVGHLPFMEKLTAFLITGTAETTVFKFQNSGIVCLDQNPDTGAWTIKWSLMPNIA